MAPVLTEILKPVKTGLVLDYLLQTVASLDQQIRQIWQHDMQVKKIIFYNIQGFVVSLGFGRLNCFIGIITLTLRISQGWPR